MQKTKHTAALSVHYRIRLQCKMAHLLLAVCIRTVAPRVLPSRTVAGVCGPNISADRPIWGTIFCCVLCTQDCIPCAYVAMGVRAKGDAVCPVFSGCACVGSCFEGLTRTHRSTPKHISNSSLSLSWLT